MHVLLILPDASMHKFWWFGRLRSAREAPLTLTTLAAIGSAVPDVTFQLVDESIDSVPLDASPDLVGISVMTGTARRAYALAQHFRARNIPVVLGGVHVTTMPDEAAQFADSLLVGPAEESFPRLLRDHLAGQRAPVYRDEAPASDIVPSHPTPRWDLQRNAGYMVPHTIQFTRGCIHACDFCSVPAAYGKLRRRAIPDILRDIAAVPARRFAVNDVSPFDDVPWAKELLRQIIPLKKKWGGLATTQVTDDPELLELLRASGCQYLLLGFESSSQRSLTTIYKGFNKPADYADVMYKLHSVGIVVQGCFVFGFDEDTPEIFSATVEEVHRLKIDIPRYSIYTPYPGTRLFQRLESENRILSYDWGDYDTMHVVFQPRQMSPVALYEGFRRAYRETFRWPTTLRRALSGGTRAPIILAGGLTYHKFWKRICSTKGFEHPLPSPPKPKTLQPTTPPAAPAACSMPNSAAAR